ncbi:MAG: hypothetical protein Fur0016_00070 [Anaerolineales bacterium]
MQNASNRYFWIFFPVLAFGLVYALTATNVYVDGDDASSVAYHVMGRNPAIQPAYSPYQGMMDLVLSILPPQESLIRATALEITRWANIVLFILMLLLIFDWLREHTQAEISPGLALILPAGVLLAMPEFFYLGLVYAPTLVSMCLILAAHRTLRYTCAQLGLKPWRSLALSLIAAGLFGIGGAFRWNAAAYLLVIAADLLIQPTHQTKKEKVKFIVLWAGLALLALLTAILLSGYGPSDFLAAFDTVLHVINQVGVLSAGSDAPLSEIILRAGLNLTPLLTPIALLFISIGMVKLAQERNPLWLVILAGILSILPWVRSGVPKFIITAIPSITLLLAVGLKITIEYIQTQPKNQRISIYALLLVGLLTPWLVGIRMAREDTSWGPGFQIRRFDDLQTDEPPVTVTFGPGMAFPTPEGARPLYGHGYILLGGWKTFVENLAQEREEVIETGLRLNVPIVVTSWSPDYYLNILYDMGFYTSDNYFQTDPSGLFIARQYQNEQGESLTLLYSEMEGWDTSAVIDHLRQITNHKQVILVGYARTMRDLYLTRPNLMQAIGTNSALIDLDTMRQETH